MNKDTLRRAAIAQLMHTKIISPRKIISNMAILIHNAQKIAIYCAIDHEIDLRDLVTMYSNREFYVPIAYKNSRIMRFEQFHSQQQIFYSNNYQLTNEIICDALDLICIPVICIDKRGYRLGRGGGYYDATLRGKSHPILCGIGLSNQMINAVPHEDSDVRLDCFVHEGGIESFSSACI